MKKAAIALIAFAAIAAGCASAEQQPAAQRQDAQPAVTKVDQTAQTSSITSEGEQQTEDTRGRVSTGKVWRSRWDAGRSTSQATLNFEEGWYKCTLYNATLSGSGPSSYQFVIRTKDVDIFSAKGNAITGEVQREAYSTYNSNPVATYYIQVRKDGSRPQLTIETLARPRGSEWSATCVPEPWGPKDDRLTPEEETRMKAAPDAAIAAAEDFYNHYFGLADIVFDIDRWDVGRYNTKPKDTTSFLNRAFDYSEEAEKVARRIIKFGDRGGVRKERCEGARDTFQWGARAVTKPYSSLYGLHSAYYNMRSGLDGDYDFADDEFYFERVVEEVNYMCLGYLDEEDQQESGEAEEEAEEE